MSCLFCRIRDGEIPAKVVHEDALCLAFEDLHPQAPTHVLVIPRKHIATSLDIAAEDEGVVGHLHRVAAEVARARGFAMDGFRTVMNTHAAAGQTVFHIHLHVLGGRNLGWPPG